MRLFLLLIACFCLGAICQPMYIENVSQVRGTALGAAAPGTTTSTGPEQFRNSSSIEKAAGTPGCMTTLTPEPGYSFDFTGEPATALCTFTYPDPALVTTGNFGDFSGCGCFYIDNNVPMGDGGIVSILTTNNGGIMGTANLVVTGGMTDDCIQLDAANIAAYTDVTEFAIRFVQFSGAFTIPSICCTAPIDCRHEITANVPTLVGDTITVRVVCDVYNQDASVTGMVTFPIPAGLGTIEGAGSCTGGATPGVLGSSWALSHTFVQGTTVDCSFSVNVTGTGTFNTLMGTVDYTSTDASARALSTSTSETPGAAARTGATPAGNICEAAVASTITTQQPQISGDPHFIGFLGQKYDFHGTGGNIYNLISDEHVQMNSKFVDADLRPLKSKTYMGQVGVKLCHPTMGEIRFLFACNRKNFTRTVSIFNERDGIQAIPPNTKFDYNGVLKVKRSSLDNGKTVVQMSGYRFQFRFSNSQHSTCHVNMRSKYFNDEERANPHGVLGQSSRGNANAIGEGRNSWNILEGEERDYMEDNLFSSSSNFALYSGDCSRSIGAKKGSDGMVGWAS